MAMTKSEQGLKDLNIDFLVKISSAALECPENLEACQEALFIVSTSIVLTTGEGRYEFQNTDSPASENVIVKKLLEKYYSMARDRGLYALVKNEERQLFNPTDADATKN